MWAHQCKKKNLPLVKFWPRWPSTASAISLFRPFAELKKIENKSPSTGTVAWLIAELKKTRADGEVFPLPLQLFLWQLVAHSDNQQMRNCFAKVIVDTGLIDDVNVAVSDSVISETFNVTLLYVAVSGRMADPTLAQLLVRSAGASPVQPRVNGDTAIQHALNWQERSYYALHGASCAEHDFRFGESAATMLNSLSLRELVDAINTKGDSIVLAGVLSRSKIFFRALKQVLKRYLERGGDEDAETVRQLVNMRDEKVGRTPLIAACNPHSILILASKVLTRHGNVGAIDPTGESGCQIDQLNELELNLPVPYFESLSFSCVD